jgi:hypothetical protein
MMGMIRSLYGALHREALAEAQQLKDSESPPTQSFFQRVDSFLESVGERVLEFIGNGGMGGFGGGDPFELAGEQWREAFRWLGRKIRAFFGWVVNHSFWKKLLLVLVALLGLRQG